MTRGLTIAAVLLLCASCSRERPPAPVGAPHAAATTPPVEEAPTPLASRQPAPPPPPVFDAPSAPAGTADRVSAPASTGDLAVGLTRDELLARLGPCARRIYLLSGGTLPTEVFEPASEGDCVDRIGARRFYVVGGRLARIEPGLSTVPEPKEPQSSAVR